MENVGTAIEIKATFIDGKETVTRSKVVVRNGISTKAIQNLTATARKLFDVDSPTI